VAFEAMVNEVLGCSINLLEGGQHTRLVDVVFYHQALHSFTTLIPITRQPDNLTQPCRPPSPLPAALVRRRARGVLCRARPQRAATCLWLFPVTREEAAV
jgi:hypothetical protein